MISARADYGGGPEHLFQLIKHLPPEFEIFVACPNEKPYWERYSKAIGRERLFEIPHRKFSPLKFFKLYFFILKNKIDLIHSHGKGAGIYSRTLSIFNLKLKCVHTFHGLHIGKYGGFKKSLYLKLERFLSFFTNRFIAVSNGEKNKIIANNFIDKAKILLIENGVKIPVLTGLDSQLNSKLIAHVTRFDYAKNTELLIDIAKLLREELFFEGFKFLIIGDGENKKDFQRKIADENLADYFEFTGAVDDVSFYFKKSFCVISTSRWEGLPLAILEAMSYGLPVIATAVTGNSELVIDGYNGYLFSKDELDEIKDYFKYLIADKKKWKFFSENSLNAVKEKYNVETMADKTARLYLETLGEND